MEVTKRGWMQGEAQHTLLLYEDLVQKHVDLVFHVAKGFCRDAHLAEELTQITFMKAWKSFSKFEQGTNFKAWILKILRNVFLDNQRASTGKRSIKFSHAHIEGFDPEAKPEPPRAIDLDSREIFYDLFGDEVARFLHQMPEEFRVAVLLADVEGLDYEEIADVLDIPRGTVGSRVHRGRAILSKSLRSYAEKLGYLKERKI
ncbi:MAG: sigma-70 family RNA polymerase sigma factor [Planctomycetes bacterium]|nr:sigma-70 family RNA polymerase sigma factor [Planctomycetota bacterium]